MNCEKCGNEITEELKCACAPGICKTCCEHDPNCNCACAPGEKPAEAAM